MEDLKLAVSGKGGVGKSTVSGALALMLAEAGRRVLAIDADPDANLADSLGIPAAARERLVSIARQGELIEARTGARPGTYGQLFTLNPEVSDIADRFAYAWRNVNLIVMGEARKGGGGCMCPENALIQALIDNLVLDRDEDVVMDMEAGIEHLGRGTARGVDAMLVVCEPGQRSIDCGVKIAEICADLGLERVAFLGNKSASDADDAFLRDALGARGLLGILRWSDALRDADRDGVSARDHLGAENEAVLRQVIGKMKWGIGK